MNFLMWFGNTTIMLMAAIMGISPEIFEAAELDGCGSVKRFFSITLPLIRPILAYTLITSIIGGLQMFDVPQILTNGQGAPDRTSMTLIMFLNNHLKSRNYGMAGALSVFLFIRFKEHTGRNRNYGFSLQVLFHCGNRLTHLCRLHCEQDDVTLPYHINCMFACMHPTHFCISAQLIPLPGTGIQLLSLYNSTRKHSICHGACHISCSDKS